MPDGTVQAAVADEADGCSRGTAWGAELVPAAFVVAHRKWDTPH